ncbi:MAG: MBL fold metallo-hydrolase [Ignavibacteriales bacterium]|nr:MBL fold metallo-hydrolase [Ignavibacteriales bacterium]
MKVIKLQHNPAIYCGNAYLLLGDWNKLDDVNTVIDTTSDSFITKHIDEINTGLGKNAVDRIILTHSHFDHNGGVAVMKKKYDCEVLAYLPGSDITRTVHDGEEIKIADCYFTVIHTPGHSSDSICLYCKKDGVLFSGDTSIRVYQNDGTYTADFVESIEKLSKLHVRIVYPGHGDPITENPDGIIKETLKILTKSTLSI